MPRPVSSCDIAPILAPALQWIEKLTRDLKRRALEERRRILNDYDAFIARISSVPQKGRRQLRHMLRFFAFPDLVERMSSSNDRRKVLSAFGVASARDMQEWSDQELDRAQVAAICARDNERKLLYFQVIGLGRDRDAGAI